jgi:hypothetical protein
VPRLKDGFASGARIDTVITTIARNNATMRSAGISLDRLVILGPAIPVEASAFLSGAHIVAQMPPTSVELPRRMSAKEQERVVTALFQGKADVAWLTTADAGVTMLVIPKVP